MDLDKIIKFRISRAKTAEMEWKWLLENYEQNESVRFVFFPKEDEEIERLGLLYLDTHLLRMGAQKAVVIYEDSFVRDNAEKYSQKISELVEYSKEEMERFLIFYELCPVDPRVTVVSLNRPYYRWASKLEGIHGITTEQLVAIGIYSIIPFRKIESVKEENTNYVESII